MQPFPTEMHTLGTVDMSDTLLWVGSGPLIAIIPPKHACIWQWLRVPKDGVFDWEVQGYTM